jgi:hypothetical protein
MTARRRSPSSCSSARELSGRELANTLGKRVAATPAMQLGQGEYDAVRVHQYAAPGQKAAEVDMRTWSRGDDGRRLVLVDGKTKADQPLEAGPESFPDSSTKETPPDVLRGVYEFLATLPGMRLIGDVKDPLGRPGTAVAVGIELILAPDTGQPLAVVHYRDGDVDDPWLYTTRQAAVVKERTRSQANPRCVWARRAAGATARSPRTPP